MRTLRPVPMGVALLLAISACGDGPAGSRPATTSGAAPTITTEPNPTMTEATTTSSPVTPADATVTVLLPGFVGFGPEWSERFFPYGESEDTLGTSPGGEGGSVAWGPEYGVQVTDGTWWFLDAARLRLAHFSDDGAYLGEVPIPDDLLADGVHFQYQLPQALDDGSLMMSGFDQPLARLAHGELTGVRIPGAMPWETTDGELLYGFAAEDGAPVRLDPDRPQVEAVDWFTTRDRRRYRVAIDRHDIVVELPDADVPITRTLQMRFADEPETGVWAGIEVESGADGTLFLYVYGVPASDESYEVGGLVTVSSDGEVSEVQPTARPFSESDPGSPARLGVRPGSSSPWIMIVGDDGVGVYSSGA